MLTALALGCSVSTTGCLVADAPNYGPPEQRPPVINAQSVSPTPYALVVVPETAPSFPISVPLRSEDAGESLRGMLYVDYGLAKQQFWSDKEIPPGSFDDLDRSYDTTFLADERVTSGCHTLTAFITHDSNFDSDKDIIIDSSDFDVASVTWWMNVKPMNPSMPGMPATPGTLEGCPTAVVAP